MTCKQCNQRLNFSARERGTGFCHSCAHAKLAALIQPFSDCIDDLETCIEAHAEVQFGLEVVRQYREMLRVLDAGRPPVRAPA